VKGIQICTNEVDNPSPRGDKSERVKLYLIFSKIIFSRTSRPNSIILNTNHPWVKRIKFVQIKGHVLFKGEIITKMKKWGGVI
jgi:hypothetical protein